jgi:hypothetical protein
MDDEDDGYTTNDIRKSCKIDYQQKLQKYLAACPAAEERDFIALLLRQNKENIRNIEANHSYVLINGLANSLEEEGIDLTSLTPEDKKLVHLGELANVIRRFSYDSSKVYIKFLKERLDELEADKWANQGQFLPSNSNKKPLSLAQIALFYIYTDKFLNQENAVSVAQKFGYKSGEKLLRHYTDYETSTRRKASSTRNKQKVKDIEVVIDYLEKNGYDSQAAQEELKELKVNISKDVKDNDRF